MSHDFECMYACKIADSMYVSFTSMLLNVMMTTASDFCLSESGASPLCAQVRTMQQKWNSQMIPEHDLKV